jgi:hypothetical protein
VQHVHEETLFQLRALVNLRKASGDDTRSESPRSGVRDVVATEKAEEV